MRAAWVSPTRTAASTSSGSAHMETKMWSSSVARRAAAKASAYRPRPLSRIAETQFAWVLAAACPPASDFRAGGLDQVSDLGGSPRSAARNMAA